MKAVTRSWLVGLTITLVATVPLRVEGEGIGGTGFVPRMDNSQRVFGQLDRFGSVVIDGVHYETSQAAIRLNGIPGTEADLKVGHQLWMHVDAVSNQALEIDQFDAVAGVVGAITEIDATMQHYEFTILRQRILTDGETVFHGLEAEALQPRLALIINGVRDETNRIHATSVELAATIETHVTGPVSSIGRYGFRIGNLRIADPYLNQHVRDGLFSHGKEVHVQGDYRRGTLYANTITAVTPQLSNARQVKLEGFVRLENGVPTVAGQRIDTDEFTAFKDGTRAALVAGARVIVRGAAQVDGTLHASAVTFSRRSRIRVDGEVDAIDLQAGWISVNGIELQIDKTVSLIDRRDHNRWIRPVDIQPYDAVSIIARATEDGLRVRRLTRKSAHQVRRLLRAPLAYRSRFNERLQTGKLAVQDLDEAQDVQLDGVPVTLRKLLGELREGDDVELRWSPRGRLEVLKGLRDAKKRRHR